MGFCCLYTLLIRPLKLQEHCQQKPCLGKLEFWMAPHQKMDLLGCCLVHQQKSSTNRAEKLFGLALLMTTMHTTTEHH